MLNYFNLDRTIFIKHRTAIQQRLKITKFSEFIAKIKRFGKNNFVQLLFRFHLMEIFKSTVRNLVLLFKGILIRRFFFIVPAPTVTLDLKGNIHKTQI